MNLTQFEELISQALDDLPPRFAKALDNVEVTAEIWPTPEELVEGRVPPGSTLYGLYRGIPQTKRANYTGVLPDKSIIFMGPIVSAYGEQAEAVTRQVRDTVLHELGHHFGLSDEEIRRAGK